MFLKCQALSFKTVSVPEYTGAKHCCVDVGYTDVHI